MAILVTGGAGYIGSHMVLRLLEIGEQVVVLDNLSTGFSWLVDARADLVIGDITDADALEAVFSKFDISAVAHFAGSLIVPESVEKPLDYYANNTSKTRDLIAECLRRGVKNFVFSSTAAVYGGVHAKPVDESAPLEPANPYGRSKLMSEWVLEDTAKAHDFRYVALRYFNVAGADRQGRSGQSVSNTTHLIKLASQTALGQRQSLTVFGDDYPTADGTCVRDFIHVEDLIEAHVLALSHLKDGHKGGVFNCGYGKGYSIREVITALQELTGQPVPHTMGDRRPGDVAYMVANSDKLRREFGWTPRYDDLKLILSTTIDWEKSLPERKQKAAAPTAAAS